MCERELTKRGYWQRLADLTDELAELMQAGNEELALSRVWAVGADASSVMDRLEKPLGQLNKIACEKFKALDEQALKEWDLAVMRGYWVDEAE